MRQRALLCFSGKSAEQKNRELPLKNLRMQTNGGRPGQTNLTGQTKL
jgi:hypothetical protein